MKRVSGYISVRALGCYEFEFYVEDNATDEEIKKIVDDRCECYMHYDVEPGYEAVTEIVYKKKGENI